MTPRTARRLFVGAFLAAPALAVSVTTLGPWVTGLLALAVFCTAAAVWRMTVAAIYGDVARMDAAAKRREFEAGIQAGFDAGWHGGTGR